MISMNSMRMPSPTSFTDGGYPPSHEARSLEIANQRGALNA